MEDVSESEQPNVGKIINDFNKNAAKKAQKKENSLISFTIKATARDQDKNIMISKLKQEIEQYLDKVTLLEMENEVKEELLHEKDNELKDLKTEYKKLKALLLEQKYHESPKVTSFISKTAINKIHNDVLSYNNNNYEVISTSSNIIASPKNEVASTNHHSVVSTTSDSLVAEVAKPKSTKLKRSFKRTKDIAYNLRKRVTNSK